VADESKTIHTFDKSTVEQIRISLNKFKGAEYVDVRIYYKASDGGYKPTKKGVTFKPDMVSELEEAVKKIKKAVK
jgi:hypothetical protein